ncbi:MAG TPA: hypothetical protein VE377_16625 [Candidatus Dormibacteraeota bacterium]|nr:hypothetical protein [Candidatus Dormibacteraeota bacterium]
MAPQFPPFVILSRGEAAVRDRTTAVAGSAVGEIWLNVCAGGGPIHCIVTAADVGSFTLASPAFRMTSGL